MLPPDQIVGLMGLIRPDAKQTSYGSDLLLPRASACSGRRHERILQLVAGVRTTPNVDREKR
jgi:hypothetical protein